MCQVDVFRNQVVRMVLRDEEKGVDVDLSSQLPTARLLVVHCRLLVAEIAGFTQACDNRCPWLATNQ